MPMHDGGEYAEWLRRVFQRRNRDLPSPASTLGIIGSSRANGNTSLLTQAVLKHLPSSQLADLRDLSVAPYDYRHRHSTDDFSFLARRMTQAKAIIFATPVYWYAMSAQMKAFIDRLSDLTETHKRLGRALEGRTIFVIATSSNGVPAYFEKPFSETAQYFNMKWGGLLHERFDQDRVLTLEMEIRANAFAQKITASQTDVSVMTPSDEFVKRLYWRRFIPPDIIKERR